MEESLIRSYEDVRHVFDDFARYMSDKKINQEEGYNFEGKNYVETECGCCVGAHLAKFIDNSNGKYFGVECPASGKLDYADICQYTMDVVDWSKDYAEWRKIKFGDDDSYSFDGWEGLNLYNNEDHAFEWIKSHDDGYFKVYHFTKGIDALHDIIGYEDEQRNYFDTILSCIVHSNGGYWAWSASDWDTDNISWALRAATIATNLYAKKFMKEISVGGFAVSLLRAGTGHYDHSLYNVEPYSVALYEEFKMHDVVTPSEYYSSKQESRW